MKDAFLIAVQFLTRLPVRARWTDAAAGRSLLFYPLVGLLIGLFLWLLVVLAPAWPPGLVAAATVTVWVLITAGLHLDGLADSADAWLGGHGDPDRTLEIMKDSACGPAGVLSLILLLLLKWQALTALLPTNPAPALLLAPLLGRSACLLLFYSTRYVRPKGLGSALAAYFPSRNAAKVLAVVGVLVVLLTGWAGLKALVIATVLFALLRMLMQRRLGGFTGDTAGATIEVVEVGVLLMLLG